MSFLGDILGGSVGKVIGAVGDVVDKLSTTDEEKAAAKLEVQKLLVVQASEQEQTLRTELASKEKILVAELTQGDGYTKRARPTLVYGGMVAALGGGVARVLGVDVDVNTLLPQDFWYVWGGVCSAWVLGRSYEKKGGSNKVSRAVTGSHLFD
jgi:hypothetical protein